jgi:predicted nucleic acid-binding protein
MKYVFDASVALKTVLPEQDSDSALRLRDEYSQGLHELLSPDVFVIEVAHSLTRAERKKTILEGEAIILYGQVLANMPELHSSLSLITRAIELSLQLRASAYDCLYVSLAERENCKLVTSDKKLVSVFSPHFPFILGLADL